MNYAADSRIMKKTFITIFAIAMVATSVFAQNNKGNVLKQSEGSITFVVDENLPAPSEHLNLTDGKTIASMLSARKDSLLIASSFDDANLYYDPYSTYFKMLIRAYAEHRPLELTPDDVWLIIQQGFAHHINLNAEQLRDKFVNHEGKITLSVEAKQNFLDPEEAKTVNWPTIFDGFVKKMKDNTVGDIVDNSCANFSTTNTESRIASQITLMNALKPYFNYKVITFACGIPYITLKGTPEDWQMILDRVRGMEQYDLKWWTDKLCPVLEEFVKTSQGNPDQQFWRCMIRKIQVDELRGGLCGGRKPTELDGWFLAFFPYDSEGRTPEKVNRYHKMLGNILSADFTYELVDNNRASLKSVPMQFRAGVMGIEEDQETYGLKARLGWLVCIKAPQPEKKEPVKPAPISSPTNRR